MRRLGFAVCVGCVLGATAIARADTRRAAGDRTGEGSTPFTGLAQTPEANLYTGGLATRIPIEVPPGRKNVTPRLALVYASAGGPSAYGYGWDLPIGRIQRSTKWGVPQCSGPHTDDFVLNMPDGVVELVADPPGSTTYRPKVEEMYLEAIRDPDNNLWVLHDRSGMKYTFGDVASARVSNTTGPCQFTTLWALTRVEDPDGNTMDVTYLSVSNVLYLATINYGANPQAGLPSHFYEVEFNYTLRPDSVESDLSGVSAVLTFRLTAIRISTTVPSPTEFRTYSLMYDAGENGKNGYQSVLSSVAVTGYPTQVFATLPGPNGLANPPSSYTPPAGVTALRVTTSSGSVSQTVMDMNGDGIVDLVKSDASPWSVYLGTPNGFATTATPWSLSAPSDMQLVRNTTTGSDWATTDRDTFDINGDGYPDFVDARTTPWKVYLGTPLSLNGGWGFSPLGQVYVSWVAPETNVRNDHLGTPGGWTYFRTYKDVIDWNGDGLPDLIIVVPSGPPYTWYVYLNTGSGFEATPIAFSAPETIRVSRDGAQDPDYGGVESDLFDFNGDGLPDLVANPTDNIYGEDERCSDATHRAGCIDVWISTGYGFATTSTVITVPPSNYIRVRTPWPGAMDTVQDMLDLNGDGLPDWVSGWLVLLNQGGRLEPTVWEYDDLTQLYYATATRVWQAASGAIRRVTTDSSPRTTIDMIDFDGDAILDRVDATATTWSVELSTQWSGTAKRTPTRPNLLGSIDNGIGGQTLAFYKPSTRYDNTGGDGAPDLPFVTWVVSGTRHLDGLCTPAPGFDFDVWSPELGLYVPADNNCISTGHELATSFTYQDGRFDAANREFLGFRTVYATNIDPSITRTTFGQDVATKGKTLQLDVYAGSVAPAQLVRSTVNSWQVATFGTNRQQLWLGASTTQLADLNASTQFVGLANDRPDAFGNITHTSRTGTGGGQIDTYTEYATPTDVWRVYDKPSHTYSLYSTRRRRRAAGRSDKHQRAVQRFDEKWFRYDNLAPGQVSRGQVTAVESWLDQWTGTPPPACTADGSKSCVRTTMAYDSYGNLTTVTDALSRDTTTTYDDGFQKFLYPYQVTNDLEHTTTTVTDYRWGRPTSVTDANNAVTAYGYDAAGRLTCVARPGDSLGNCTTAYTYTYATQAGALSSVAVHRKDANQTATYPNQPMAGYVTTTQYFDAAGRARHTAGFRVVDGSDQTIISGRLEYDPGGRVAGRDDPYPLAPSIDAGTSTPGTANNGVSTYEYLLNGAGVVDPLGRIHILRQSDGTSRTTTYLGFSTTTYDEENHKRVTITDYRGRVVEDDVYTGTGPTYTRYATTTSTYDGAGRLLSTIQNGNVQTAITVTYDTLGRKVGMTDPDTGAQGNAGTWRYGYDLVGNLIDQDDPAPGQHVQFCVDALNRVTKKFTFPSDAYQAVNCGADPAATQYTYDVTSDGVAAKGRLGSVTDPSGSTAFTYDVRGRVTSTSKTITVDGDSKSTLTAVSYDSSAADRVATTTYPDGEVVTTSYDHSGQPLGLSSMTTYVAEVRYDVFGRLTLLQHGNGTTDTRTYHGQPGQSLQEGHRLAQVRTQGPGGTYLDLSYADYTARGLLAQLTDTRDASGPLSNTAQFAYDDLGRLAAVTNSPNMTATYAYSALGNLTSKDGQSYTYDAAKPHQPTHVGGTAFSYDPNGNTSLGRAGQQYVYDADDRLTELTAGGTTVRFLSDFSGQRVAKVVGTSVTRYYGALLESTDGELTKFYELGGQRVAAQRVLWSAAALGPQAAVQVAATVAGRPAVVILLRRDVQLAVALSVVLCGSVLLLAPWRRKRVVGLAVRHGHVVGVVLVFAVGTLPWGVVVRPLGPRAAVAQTPPVLVHFHVDHLGSTQVLTDAAGLIVTSVRYTAYGAVRGHFNASGAAVSDCADDRYCHEFTGYDTEPISGLAYAVARYYDAAVGLFLTHDPVRSTASPYSYAAWNPTNQIDVNGEFPYLAALVVAAFVATAIDAGIRTGSVGAAFKAGAISAGVTLVTAGVVSAGLGVVHAAVGQATYATTVTALKVAGVAAGAYGTYQAANNGYYATASLAAVLTAYGVYDVLAQGANGANPDPRPLSPEERQYLDQLHGRDFGGVNIDEGFVGERFAAGQVRSDSEINVESGFSGLPRTERLGLLGHEGTHIVQRQLGTLNNFKGFFSHLGASITGGDLYAIPSDYSGSFSNLNFEQQAVVVENVGRLRLGQSPARFPYGGNLSVPRTLGLYMEYRGVLR